MPTFKDTTGRTWTYEIDVPSLKRVRTIAGVDLLTVDVEVLLADMADPIKLIDTLYAFVHPETVAAGLTDEDFGAAMGIDPDPLADDLLRALADFFPRLGRKRLATTLIYLLDRSKDAFQNLPKDQIQNRMHHLIDQELHKLTTSGKRFTNSQASPEPTPTPPEPPG